jgi:hypothetical protein
MIAALAPMEAKLVSALPDEPGWQFEPKWDGFRALVFPDGDDIEILSKSGKSLARYFPEIMALVAAIPASRFVLDGELILPIGEVLSFDSLQARLHPAARSQNLRARRLRNSCCSTASAWREATSRASRLASVAPRWRRFMPGMEIRRCYSRRGDLSKTHEPGLPGAAVHWMGAWPSVSMHRIGRANGRCSRSNSDAPPTASWAVFAVLRTAVEASHRCCWGFMTGQGA